MNFAFATEPAPGRANEDYLIVTPAFAVVLDGVTQLPGLDTGCVHGPRWLVRALGSRLAESLSRSEATSLDQLLAEAIDAVCRQHADTCDLGNPNSPSSTVAIVRERTGYVDYLVLCDSTVVIERPDGVFAVNDDRTETLTAYDRDSVALARNRPGGFWVASTVPAAAGEALTGSVPGQDVRRLLMCTDGAARLVDYFGFSWPDVFDVVQARGPYAAIDAVRTCEDDQPEKLARRGRTVKRHDDATLVLRLLDRGSMD